MGLSAPLVHWACADARAALHHARTTGIPDTDALHRLYHRISAALCSRQAAIEWALFVLAALLTVLTTVAVVAADPR
jgi:fumarate reductase subunit D